MSKSKSEDSANSQVDFGTPLPEYDEDEVPAKKPIHIEDQVVTDEKGRRRFHGAFTGGFSAGYFNSVGTEEGWVPSTFVSSRSGRADRRQQRPEDFMDTEDLGEFGIAHRSIRVTEDFAEATRKRPAPKASQGPIPGEPVLERFIIPVSESKGVRMLRKLGWKPGQGIGPRVKSKPTVEESELSPEEPKEKVYGCSLPPSVWRSDHKDDEDEDFTLGLLYAPDDVDPAHFTPKTDQHGIGYKGLDRRSVLTSMTKTTAVVDRAKKLAISGEAFGVGAFEHDDESIYTTEDMSQYDFDIRDADDPKPAPKKPVKQIQGTSDIAKVLEGFHLSSKPPPKRDMFPAPDLPRDFRPIHRHVIPAEEQAGHDTRQGLNRHSLNANDRGRLIEESGSGSKPRKTHHEGSVLNLLSARDRARLEVMSKFALGQAVETNAQKYSSDGRFRPFASDPLKQQRFEVYTKLFDEGSNMKEAFQQHQLQTMTDWEKTHEAEEFQRAAILYKPLRKTAMMSRFVPASQSGEVEEPKPGLSIQAEAAKAKKYGDFTREKFEWHPDKILCRRFNVPNPYPDSAAVGIPNDKRDKFSIFDFLSVEAGPELKRDVTDTDKRKQESSIPSDPVSKGATVQASTSNTVDETPIEKPTLDLFKTIFEDSSSDEQSSSSDEEVELMPPPKKPPKKVVPTPQPTIPQPKQDKPTPSTESPKKPVEPSKGIFANVDFDRLNTQGPPVLNFISDIDVEVFRSIPSQEDSSSNANRLPKGSSTNSDVYGPSLPPNQVESTSRQEMHHHSRKKSHKEKTKKHKKEKRKSKRKRSRSKRRSSSSSSDTQDEVEFVSMEEKDFNASILRAMKNLSKR